MRSSAFLPLLFVPGALVACTDSDPDRTPIITDIPVARCGAEPGLDQMQIVAQGTVVDFLTGEPQAGVTVDIARVWEPEAAFPADSCSLAQVTTDDAGRFGPITVDVGPTPSLFESKFVVFLAQGGNIAPTASDNRVSSNNDTLDHRIAAPSLELMDAWRAELSDGGMARARTRGLVAFRFDDGNDVPAAGVVATRETLLDSRPLTRGREVRYLSADRSAIEPLSRQVTTESGLALIGVDPNVSGTSDVGGLRGDQGWGDIGCLVGEGWTFLEWSRPVVR